MSVRQDTTTTPKTHILRAELTPNAGGLLCDASESPASNIGTATADPVNPYQTVLS